jgi:hypothetical protein
MPTPVCPCCAQNIEWRHSLMFWNPWDYSCPHCQRRLEASRIQKIIAMAVIPGGAALALLFHLLKQQFGVTKSGLLALLGVVCVLLVVGARWSWNHTTFSKRD